MADFSVTIFHNPRCSKSRGALTIIKEQGIDPTVVHYLETPVSAGELKNLLAMLSLSPRELMRKGEAVYSERGLDDPALTEDDLIDAIVANPILMERPIVVANGKAIIGRPPECVLDVL